MMVARFASLVSLKIRFHAKFSSFDSHYCDATSGRGEVPRMPRIFVVKALASLLDVGANADAVCGACFTVIADCLKFSDGVRAGSSTPEHARLALSGAASSAAVLSLAIEASFALAPVLDESSLVYNACERLAGETSRGDGGREGDGGGTGSVAYTEAMEGHGERKANLEAFKVKAGEFLSPSTPTPPRTGAF